MPDSSTIASGFDPAEAKTILSIEQQTYEGTPDNPPSGAKGIPPVPKPPSNWQIDANLTPTKTTLLDNFWQVWQNSDNPKQYAIAVRGTVATTPSIIADLLLPMIRARHSFTINIGKLPVTIDFNLAQEETGSAVVAGVHAGFALSLLLMLISTDKPLFLTLAGLPKDAQVYITGHSQGASIALLMTSLVRHSTTFFKGPAYKTYVFAPAKPGNDHYAYDLDQIAGMKGWCYSVVNSQDWVPQVPLTLQTLNTINTPNPLKKYDGQPDPDAPADLASIASDIERAEEGVRNTLKANLDKRFAKLKQDLPSEAFVLNASDLGGSGDATLDGAGVSGILDELLGMILPTLNYAKAGTLAPVFGTPGGNPKDPSDYFWQHHLGNYLKALDAQYGTGA